MSSRMLTLATMTTRRGARCAAAVCLMLLVASAAAALDGDSSGLTLESRVLAGNPHDVLVSGDVAWLALDSGVAAMDLADPSDPQLVAHVALPSAALGLARVGATLLVAAGDSGLLLLDVGNPLAVNVVATVPAIHASDVALSGALALVALDSGAGGGLLVVDVSTPAAPVALGSVPLSSGGRCVTAAGSLALVGTGSAVDSPEHGLHVVDISTPSSPLVAGFLDVGLPVNDIALTGGRAVLAVGLPLAGALVVADVSVPSAPVRVGTLRLADAALGVAEGPTGVHVAARSLGVVQVDIADPANPLRVDARSTGREAVAVAMLGGRVLAAERSSAGRSALCVLSPLGGRLEIEGLAGFGEVTGLSAAGGLVHVLRREALWIFDVGDPKALAPLGRWEPPGADLAGLAVDAGLAAVGHADRVHLLDVSDPTAPVELGVAVLDGGAVVDVALLGGVLAVADGRGLQVFDVSAPNAPMAAGRWTAGAWCASVALADDLAWVAAGDTLHVLDLPAPSAPSPRGSLVLGEPLSAVDARNGLVVLAGLTSDLFVIDGADPASPSLLATVPGGAAFDVRLSGGRAFVAAGPDGVLVYDLADPGNPVLDGFYDTATTATGVAADGAVVHLATADAQHWVFDCARCLAGCEVLADLQPPTATICEGETLLLDASASSLPGCDPADVTYRWSVDGQPLVGGSGETFEVPDTQAPDGYLFEVEASCATAPGCTDTATSRVTVEGETFPVVVADSLRARKDADADVFTWVVANGSGLVNVHRTLLSWELSPVNLTAATVVATEAAAEHRNMASPSPETCLYFRVFGRKACSGDSVLDP